MPDEQKPRIPPSLENLFKWTQRLGPSQRYLGVLILAVGMGLLLLWGSNLSGSGPPTQTENVQPEQRALQRDEGNWTEEQWERELSVMLSHIKGAGQVWVDLTLEGSEVQVWQEKEESESRQVQEDGTSHHREQQNRVNRDLVFTQRNGVEVPVLQQKRRPRVRGVVIVAEGANDPVVREELWQAVAVATGAELHKITVIAGEKH